MPILFCLVEEVLSMGITKLVEEGKQRTIYAQRGIRAPSHVFHADGLVVFYNGEKKGLKNLLNLLERYGESLVSNEKSSIIFRKHVQRKAEIKDLFGFSEGTTPFTYLGVPISRGRPKAIYFDKGVDKVVSKLASWKGSMLIMVGRLQLIKSVIQGMLVHNIMVYKWPKSSLNRIVMHVRNFFWSGDGQRRKIVTVAWKNMCCSRVERGLGTHDFTQRIWPTLRK